MLIVGERHLTKVLTEYTAHYNRHRPHRSLEQRPPNPPTTVIDLNAARVRRRPILGGMINEYSQAAQPEPTLRALQGEAEPERDARSGGRGRLPLRGEERVGSHARRKAVPVDRAIAKAGSMAAGEETQYRIDQVSGGDVHVGDRHHYGPRLVWTAGIIASVVVGGLLTAMTMYLVGPASGGQQPQAIAATSSAPSAGNGAPAGGGTSPADVVVPFTVTVSDRTSPCGGGWVVAEGSTDVPDPAIGSDREYAEWAGKHGAVPASTGRVEMVLQGRSAAQVTLLRMRVRVTKRSAPTAGTLYGLRCGGEGVYRWVTADLDAPSPTLKSKVDDALDPDGTTEQRQGPIKFPYEIAVNDTELFLVNGTTLKCTCEWVIEVDWSSEGAQGTKVIDDGGRPFRTTANTAVSRTCMKEQFKAVDPAADCRAGAPA